jgi:hypothetical protein
MIADRYWLIGAPTLVTLVAFLARAWFCESTISSWRSLPLAATAGALVFLGSSSVLGFFAARHLTAEKPIWKGAAIVTSLLQGCPAGSVRVLGFLPGFAEMAGVPVTMFVDVTKVETVAISPAEAACPVLGWAEHVRRGDDFMARATDATLLEMLKIQASPAEVDVRRHHSGFVVLRRSV